VYILIAVCIRNESMKADTMLFLRTVSY